MEDKILFDTGNGHNSSDAYLEFKYQARIRTLTNKCLKLENQIKELKDVNFILSQKNAKLEEEYNRLQRIEYEYQTSLSLMYYK